MSRWELDYDLDNMLWHIAGTLNCNKAEALKKSIILLSVLLRHSNEKDQIVEIDDNLKVKIVADSEESEIKIA